jgi:hypothetical protein
MKESVVRLAAPGLVVVSLAGVWYAPNDVLFTAYSLGLFVSLALVTALWWPHRIKPASSEKSGPVLPGPCSYQVLGRHEFSRN